jgi:hypothetical protein
VIELCYVAAALPKLYVVTINELLSVLFGRVIVRTKKLDRSDETTVYANDVRRPSHFVAIGFPRGWTPRKVRRSLSTFEHKPNCPQSIEPAFRTRRRSAGCRLLDSNYQTLC